MAPTRPTAIYLALYPVPRLSWWAPPRHKRLVMGATMTNETARSDPVAVDELADDDVALDVVGPLADHHQRRVAVVTLDVELGRIPVAPVHPDRVGGDLQAGLGREQLRHPRLQVAAPPGVERGGRAGGEQARGLHERGHVGEAVADRLVPPDRLPEGLPLLRVPQRVLQRGPGHPDRPRRDLDPAEFEPVHHLGEPGARLPAE